MFNFKDSFTKLSTAGWIAIIQMIGIVVLFMFINAQFNNDTKLETYIEELQIIKDEVGETINCLELTPEAITIKSERLNHKWYTEEEIKEHTIDKAVLREIISSKVLDTDMVEEIEKLLGDEK